MFAEQTLCRIVLPSEHFSCGEVGDLQPELAERLIDHVAVCYHAPHCLQL